MGGFFSRKKHDLDLLDTGDIVLIHYTSIIVSNKPILEPVYQNVAVSIKEKFTSTEEVQTDYWNQCGIVYKGLDQAKKVLMATKMGFDLIDLKKHLDGLHNVVVGVRKLKCSEVDRKTIKGILEVVHPSDWWEFQQGIDAESDGDGSMDDNQRNQRLFRKISDDFFRAAWTHCAFYPPQMLRELKRSFALVDSDGSGSLNKGELVQAIQGMENSGLTEDHLNKLEEMFHLSNKNEEIEITYDSFEKALTSVKPKDIPMICNIPAILSGEFLGAILRHAGFLKALEVQLKPDSFSRRLCKHVNFRSGISYGIEVQIALTSSRANEVKKGQKALAIAPAPLNSHSDTEPEIKI
eukprot:TRINITY_DN14541_c0_g1_i1.p1 TRINITY_DN14541_c0_g1~~TRINITY_DN14541_c0_g1_i1.p1  ORF type:complete len:351 (+),score=73.87 TRINITY_DN14541_c0_g1_i1:100-1152(+)